VDDIDPSLAAPYLARIAKPLAEVINCSLSSGAVPDAIAIAKILPILKKGDKDNVSNYRPISVLPYFSKFYEKLMHSRLSNYVKKIDIISRTAWIPTGTFYLHGINEYARLNHQGY
jgi:hypothetical protein